jgi:RNA polymerase sigma-70 factor (ECF subfamily)
VTGADPFEAFVREYQDMVFATAVRLLGNPVDAEDVSQTVFLKAFERFSQIAGSPAAAGWLKTVATNLCLNHLSRYRARWRLFSELQRDDEDGGGVAFEETVAAPGTPAAALDEAEEQEQLEQAVRGLPDHQRVPLVLFHFEQKSYQEIAETLGISLAKVKTDIFRGREALRKTLWTLKSSNR